MEEVILNPTEAQMRVGAKIQKFYDVLQEQRVELKSWVPEDEIEERIKRVKEDFIFSLMHEYFELFDSIIVGGS